MKKNKIFFGLAIIVFLVLAYFFLNSILEKEIDSRLLGKWGGYLKTPNKQLVIYADILNDGNKNIELKISSPKQNQYLIPTDSLVINNNEISFAIKKYRIHYKGKVDLDSSRIIGTWFQDNFSSKLIFYRPDEILRTDRPQHPFKPYSYNSDSVYFYNSDSIRLAGTLTYPKDKNKKYPTILLINGLGKHDRDETMYRHKPFLVLSDYLTKNGYAVLRVDDRGVGESQGNFEKATTKDFTNDMISALNFLKTQNIIDTNKIGLLGFNEGGLIASNIAAKLKGIGFVILLSTPGLTGKEILLTQTVDLQEKSGIPDSVIERDLEINKKILNIIATVKDSMKAYNKLRDLYSDFRASLPDEDLLKKKYSVQSFKNQLKFMLSPWFKYYLTYNPSETFKNINIPVLVVFGGKDVQVNAQKNNEAIINAFRKAGNQNIKDIIFPNLNHLLQKSQTGLPNEYSKINETISPEVLDTLISWLNNIQQPINIK
jgi:pimeloyl-ACP methyl ester carboxylesterase